ncbi:BrnA antitoxin family protein [Ferrovum sp.]|uniref:BrnA antitoxin family protein n=1 Tax=Ferrovum sp. TaxID=2609467 RepID=UPI002615D5F8|nr:BrnA antitoxin family protein [Ferrovum sp.]
MKELGFFPEQNFQAGVRPAVLVGDQIQGIQQLAHPLTDEFWKNAVRNPFYRPTKQATTVRIDADVLAWLRSKGKGYQTKINAILRDAMIHEITHEQKKASS